MKQSQKIKSIMIVCIVMVVIFSGIVLIRSVRPSLGSSYEKLTWEEAQEYMSYEGEYYLLDVSADVTEEADKNSHEVKVAYDELIDRIGHLIPEQTSVIYICSRDPLNDDKAAKKLSQAGYTGVAVITDGRPKQQTAD